ncbi:MAG TPA: GlsB/YeaQ/YmgE family stress response membrane protein [Alphaproteobacteria bacterium]|nr:GlsB/YeaQ/YmgE family stress response membrane protein [Alphaproteobacteria bacterium]
MWIIGVIVIGFVVGLIARFVLPGRDSLGIILTTAVGIAGAFLAQFVGQAAGLYGYGQPAGFIASIIGAIVLLLLLRVARRGGGP